jgi:hypothetical protein
MSVGLPLFHAETPESRNRRGNTWKEIALHCSQHAGNYEQLRWSRGRPRQSVRRQDRAADYAAFIRFALARHEPDGRVAAARRRPPVEARDAPVANGAVGRSRPVGDVLTGGDGPQGWEEQVCLNGQHRPRGNDSSWHAFAAAGPPICSRGLASFGCSCSPVTSRRDRR